MMITYFCLISAIFIPLLGGYLFLSVFLKDEKFPFVFNVSLAYGLGLGFLSMIMLMFAVLRIPFTLENINIVWGVEILICWILIGWKKKQGLISIPVFRLIGQEPDFKSTAMKLFYSISSVIFVFIIIHSLAYVFWKTGNDPIYTWDGISTVAYKAKIFFHTKHLPNLQSLPHPTYPLLTPFMETWIALNLGEWHDQWIKIFFPLTLLSYVVIHYCFLAFYTNKFWARLGCVLLLSSNILLAHATISYRDLFMMYFNCLTIILLVLWQQRRSHSLLLLASIFAGFGSFAKLEGTAFLLIYTLIVLFINWSDKLLFFKKKLIRLILFVIPSYGMCFVFHAYKIMNRILSDGDGLCDKTKFDLTIDKIKLIPFMLFRFMQFLFYPGDWALVWVVFFISLFFVRKQLHFPEMRVLLLAVFSFFGLYFCMSLFTVNYVWIAGELGEPTFPRLILHFYPLSVLIIILNASYLFGSRSIKS